MINLVSPKRILVLSWNLKPQVDRSCWVLACDFVWRLNIENISYIYKCMCIPYTVYPFLEFHYQLIVAGLAEKLMEIDRAMMFSCLPAEATGGGTGACRPGCLETDCWACAQVGRALVVIVIVVMVVIDHITICRETVSDYSWHPDFLQALGIRSLRGWLLLSTTGCTNSFESDPFGALRGLALRDVWLKKLGSLYTIYMYNYYISKWVWHRIHVPLSSKWYIYIYMHAYWWWIHFRHL